MQLHIINVANWSRPSGLTRAILSGQPDDPEVLQLLGVVAVQRGQLQQAIQLIERAIGITPNIAAYHANLAEAYRAAGQPDAPSPAFKSPCACSQSAPRPPTA